MRTTPDAVASHRIAVLRFVRFLVQPLTRDERRSMKGATLAEREPRSRPQGRVNVKLVHQAANRAESCAETPARGDTVTNGAVQIVDAWACVPVEKLDANGFSERRRIVKPAAAGRIARGVRPYLLHDDVQLRQLRLSETKTARKAMHRPPRRADLGLVFNLDGVNCAHK